MDSRVYIINGPLINTINNLSGDILQSSLQEVDNPPSDQTQVDQFIEAVQNTEQDSCVDELVTFKQENGDEPSAIYLTAEQAVALGLELVDLPSNTSFSNHDKVIGTSKDQFVFSKDPSDNICLFTASNADANSVTNATFDATEPNETSTPDDISKLKLDSNIIEQITNTINPQFRLVPQIENGAIASHTFQLVTNETNQLPTNNFNLASANDSAPDLAIEKSVATSKFDLSSLTTSTLVQSSLSMSTVSNTINILTETGETLSSQSGNNENLVVFGSESLPEMIESDLLSNKYSRFIRLNPKSILNSSTKSQPAPFMSEPPPLEPISSVSNSSATSTQLVRSKTLTSNSFSLTTDQIKVQTVNLSQNGKRLVALKPGLPKTAPKEVSKVTVTLHTTPPTVADNGAKVGTNKNPIMFVQQPTDRATFTSTQEMTVNQLDTLNKTLEATQDIIAQLAADPESVKNEKGFILGENGTAKIHLKVMNPEDLHLKKPGAYRKRGRPKVTKVGGDATTTQTPPAAEEPPRKKVPLPRTRSGRLSRPPRHIVRDYKRIRRLDDDVEQEGSYSDYQTDDQEDTADSATDNQLLPGLADKKRKISSSFRCPSCNKVYLGVHRMENHYFKYPNHRPPPPPPNQQPNAVPQSDTGVPGLDKPVIQQRIGGAGVTYPKRRFKRRFKPEQMRYQLKQLLNLCSESDLVEVVGPVLASVLSAWELLLLRVDALTSSTIEGGGGGVGGGGGGGGGRGGGREGMGGGGKRTQALCDEFKSLLTSFTEASSALFQPLDSTDPCLLDAATFEMKDLSVSSVLGVPCGIYRVDEDSLKIDKIISQRKSDTDSGVGGLSDAAVTHPLSDTPCVSTPPVLQQQADEKSVAPFLLGGENVEELDRFVENFTSTSRDLSKSEVDELVFNAAHARTDLDLSLSEQFLTIGGEGRRPAHVSASTEDLIKSLENFVSADDLPSDDRTGFDTGADNFNRVDGVDTLDFDVLSRNFHTGGGST